MCWSDVGTHRKNDALQLLWVCAEFRFAVVTVPHCHGKPIQEMPNTDCKQLLFRVSQMIGIRGQCCTHIPNSHSVTKKRKKRAKEEMRLLWGSIWPFCIKSQNGPIKPWATNSTLFFSFLLSFTCSAAHVASPPLPRSPTFHHRGAQVATSCYWSKCLPEIGNLLLFPSIYVAGTLLTLALPSPHSCVLWTAIYHPWLTFVSCGQLFNVHGWLDIAAPMPLLELHLNFSNHAQAAITSHTYTVLHQRVAASHSFLACRLLSLTVAASHSCWACCLLSLIVAHLQKQQQSTKALLSIGRVRGSNHCHALEMSHSGCQPMEDPLHGRRCWGIFKKMWMHAATKMWPFKWKNYAQTLDSASVWLLELTEVLMTRASVRMEKKVTLDMVQLRTLLTICSVMIQSLLKRAAPTQEKKGKSPMQVHWARETSFDPGSPSVWREQLEQDKGRPK